MTDVTRRRSPQAFSIGDPPQSPPKPARAPAVFDADVTLTSAEDDPFLAEQMADPPVAAPRRRGFPLFSILTGALGLLFSAAFALWLDGLIRDLYARADWLGYAALTLTGVAVLAALGMVGREIWALRRLASVQDLKREAEIALSDRKPAHARAVVAKLVALSASIPETEAGRKALAATEKDVIDPEGLIRLAELELLSPADRRARRLILDASKRVSIVTAVSPRAIVDLGYVLFESARLVRTVAETYGTRPGRLGMLRLFGDVIAHLAVTGSIAVGDGIAQQVLGHGVASKISARLGEGVINGLMTARIGIAAMDLLRPLPFRAQRRPGVSDFVGDLTGYSGG
jgi:putative membrane protein